MMQVMPLAFSSRSRFSRCWESSSLRAAVGSSRMSSLTLLGERLGDLDQLLLADAQLRDRGERAAPQPDPCQQVACLAVGLAQSIRPRVTFSLPRKMFSAMERCGISASSWWMMTIPLASLSLIEGRTPVRPRR
jgi:hypothetical protein